MDDRAAARMAGHVALYCRLSPRPDGKSEGVDVQERAGREYAAQAWPGVPVVVYPDRLLSASDDTWRPGFEKLRAAVIAGEVAQIWCREQSRLDRKETGWFTFAAQLVAADIDEVHTTYDGIVRVADDVAGIKAVLAAGEIRRMKKRVNARLSDNAAQGVAPGSLPFGYVHGLTEDGAKTYVIVPEQAQAIRDAAERVLSGWSLASAAAALREDGVTGAHKVTGADGTVRQGRITHASVRSWLTNPTVAGKRVHKGVIVGDGNWPAILDEATWQACRAKLAAPRSVRRADGTAYPVGDRHTGYSGRRYLLTGGLIACGVCGAAMVGSVKQLRGGAKRGGRDVAYYLCHPSKGGRACTGIMLEQTEEHVLDELWAELDKPGFLDAIVADGHAGRRDEISTELAGIDGQRAELAGLWGRKALSSDEWAAAREALDGTERTLRAELDEKAAPPAVVSIEEARQAWPDMTLGEQREFLRLFIEKVTVSRAVPGLRHFDGPGRVAVEWRQR